mmetsp:Transcript_9775/g.12051  ORF Transcript_9775/g.12051 Transcript_9775/m.12051 type:complete len:465 (+) Transcript_9775:109-1503(+)
MSDQEETKQVSVHFENENEHDYALQQIKESPFDPLRYHDLPIPTIEGLASHSMSPRSADSELTNFSDTSFANTDDTDTEQGCFDRWFIKPKTPLTKYAKERIRMPISKLDPIPNITWHALYLKLPLLTQEYKTAWYLKLLPSCKDSRSFDQGHRSLLWHAVRLGDWFAVQGLIVAGHGDLIIKKDKYLKLDVTHIAILFDSTISAQQRNQSVPDPREFWDPKDQESQPSEDKRVAASWRQPFVNISEFVKEQMNDSDEEILTDVTSDDDGDVQNNETNRTKMKTSIEEWSMDQINRRKVRELIHDEVKKRKRDRRRRCYSTSPSNPWAICLRRMRGLNSTLHHTWLVGPTSDIEWYNAFEMMPLSSSEVLIAKFERILKDLGDKILFTDLNGASILWHACRIENNSKAIKCLAKLNIILRIVRVHDRLFKLEPYDVRILCLSSSQFYLFFCRSQHFVVTHMYVK